MGPLTEIAISSINVNESVNNNVVVEGESNLSDGSSSTDSTFKLAVLTQ